MKNFFNALFSIFESMGRARAATYYSRQGNHEAAKRIMLEK